MRKYPTVKKVIYLPENFGITFYIDEFFNYLLEKKVMPSPLKKYRTNQPVIKMKYVNKILNRANFVKLREAGLLTFVQKDNIIYIVKDDLWNALKEFLKVKHEKYINLNHCKA